MINAMEKLKEKAQGKGNWGAGFSILNGEGPHWEMSREQHTQMSSAMHLSRVGVFQQKGFCSQYLFVALFAFCPYIIVLCFLLRTTLAATHRS